MGSRGYFAEEEPLHVVKVEGDPRVEGPWRDIALWMAETPVTQEQFVLWTQAESVEHENRFKGHPKQPAENMTWREAIRYCDWLTRTQGANFPEGFAWACLPTEAEWEYACRAGTETEYYTGDGEGALAQAGRFGEDYQAGPHEVRSKAANACGLSDLHGNVWQWCHDEWDAGAYRSRVDGEADPGWQARLRDWQSGLEYMTGSSSLRVQRGGSWDVSAVGCRSAYRFWWDPDFRFRLNGFRVCLAPGPAVQQEQQAGEYGVEPVPGDGGGGTEPESEGSGGTEYPDLSKYSLPREARRKI